MAVGKKNPEKNEPKFSDKVYQALLQVPAGKVITYGGLALLAGRPKAARAVGTLMAQTPYGGLLPCHRVVSSTGKLSSRDFRQEQARRLKAEGIEVHDFTVDLKQYGWNGRE